MKWTDNSLLCCSLLGHNGAGKVCFLSSTLLTAVFDQSTTIGMLSGMLQPSAGEVAFHMPGKLSLSLALA